VPALWTGLLYDQTALDAAYDLVKNWTAEEREALRTAVPRTALATPLRGGTVLDVAREMLAIARDGLRRRARLDGRGRDETIFLDPVENILREGCTPAQELLLRYEGPWGRRTGPLFTEFAF
jgi:glutamate--cysteine ligase